MESSISNPEKKQRDFSDFYIECREKMSADGIPLDGLLVADGVLHRFSSDGKRRDKPEWYSAHEGVTSQGNPYLNVTYGSWRSGEESKCYTSLRSSNATRLYSEKEKIEISQGWKELNELQKRRRLELQEEAAKEAEKIWREAQYSKDLEAANDYIKLKQIDGLGIRFGRYEEKPAILIPLYNNKGELRNIQHIFAGPEKFDKRPITCGEIKGIFHSIEGRPYFDAERIYIAEGWATAKTIYNVLDKKYPVIMAINANNIIEVVKSIREKYDGEIIIAADNDESGTGKRAADNAAHKYAGCKVVMPPQVKEDFNDMYCRLGKDATKEILTVEDTQYLEKLKHDAQEYLVVKDPCASFSVSKLPQLLKDYVEILQLKTEAHPIMITASLLTMVSAEIGKRAYVEAHTRLYPNMWSLCITGSGRFKTTALRIGSRVASRKDKEVIKELRYLNAALKNEIVPRNKIEIRAQIDEQRMRQRVWEPDGGSLRSFLERISLGGNPGIYISEFGSFLQTISKDYNTGFKQTLTNLYDVPLVGSYETQTSGSFYYERPFFSLCGMSTPEWIQKETAIDDATGGFYARFLMYAPQIPFKRRSLLPDSFDGMSEIMQEKADARFDSWLTRKLETLGQEKSFQFSADGKDALEQHATLIERRLGNLYEEEPWCSFVGRWEPYLIKLSMIMQIVHEPEKDISPYAVECAWNILEPSIESTIHLFTKTFATGKFEAQSAKVLGYIARKTCEKGYATRIQIFKSGVIEGRAKDYDEIFTLLLERGDIVEEKSDLKENTRYRFISTK